MDKNTSEGSVRVYFQLQGNINELSPSLLEENQKNCFPGNHRTGMDVRFRLWEEEENRGRWYSGMETDEKKGGGLRIKRKLTRFNVNLAGEVRDRDSWRHLVKVH